MARLDVYRINSRLISLVIDVQAELLSYLDSRAVVPLYPEGKVGPTLTQLNPILEIGGSRFVFFPQQIAALPRRTLRQPIASLAEHHDKITRALDILLTGF